MAELDARLAERGVASGERASTIGALVRTGLLDDARLAERRAASLSDRGLGDAAIRRRLRDKSIDHEAVERALALLEPERDRATRILERRDASQKTVRFLLGRGFTQETVSDLVARHRGGELG